MKRTLQQNKALWVFYQLLADALNDSGLDMRVVLKPSVSIPWTKDSVHEQLWRPIQKALYNKESTTELDKVKEVDHIHEVLMRHLGEKFEIEYIGFPHDEARAIEALGGYKTNAGKTQDNYEDMTESTNADKF